MAVPLVAVIAVFCSSCSKHDSGLNQLKERISDSVDLVNQCHKNPQGQAPFPSVAERGAASGGGDRLLDARMAAREGGGVRARSGIPIDAGDGFVI